MSSSSPLPPPSSTPPRGNNTKLSQPVPSSPPSSPPGFPWDHAPQPVVVTTSDTPTRTENAFTVLGKRTSLKPLFANVPSKRTKPTPPPSSTPTQTHLSLGQKTHHHCPECQMSYTLTCPADVRLHATFHAQTIQNKTPSLSRDFLSQTPAEKLFKGLKDGEKVCAIDCFDSAPRKRRAQIVLDVVQADLGAVGLEKERVWEVPKKGPLVRWRAYLYVKQTKCVGFLLMERIREARRVVNGSEPLAMGEECQGFVKDEAARKAKSAAEALRARRKSTRPKGLGEGADKPLCFAAETFPARLGTSRVWTASTHRGQGVASRLLDVVLEDHERGWSGNGMDGTGEGGGGEEGPQPAKKGKVLSDDKERLGSDEASEKLGGKALVAFSQPTESGAHLARRWFGMEYGWGVYV